jgi:glucosylceramidase
MKYRKLLCQGLCLTALLVNLHAVAQEKKKDYNKNDVEFWITKADRSSLLSKTFIQYSKGNAQSISIEVDPKKTLQVIDGFGYALTGGSAMLLHQMSSSTRTALLKELFLSDDNNIGVSYLRISIGASDLDDHVFSYAPEKFDENGNGFSLDEDRKNLIPVLKEILAIVPSIKIMASPWSAPPWMKTNLDAKGGTLKPEYYDAYARYFVKYIQEMKKEGIVIDAVTLQNEPEHPGNTPSMLMTAEDEANFVKNNLGPAFKSAEIKTKIIVFDHNCDHPQYPIAVLNDAKANSFIDGSAFHMYLGNISAMSTVHDAHPEKNIYFTEQWTSGKGDFGGDLMWHVKNLIIGGTRNWAKTVIEWNLAADPNFNPHTSSGGCTICQGALTVDGNNVKRNVSYYIIAQASKFIPAGSKRVASNFIEDIPNVAFITPSGKKVMIVLNEGEIDKAFTVSEAGKSFNISLPGRTTGTLIWK